MSADHFQNCWFSICIFSHFSSVAFFNNMTIWATSHRYFGTCICTILQISASSKSPIQFLKIQVTRTPFQICIFFKKTLIEEDSAYIFFKYWQCLCWQPTDNAKMVKRRAEVCFSLWIKIAAFHSKFVLVVYPLIMIPTSIAHFESN